MKFKGFDKYAERTFLKSQNLFQISSDSLASVYFSTTSLLNRFDEGLTLETSAFKLFKVAKLRFEH